MFVARVCRSFFGVWRPGCGVGAECSAVLVGDGEGAGLAEGELGVAGDGDVACVVLVVVGVADEHEVGELGCPSGLPG